MRVGNWPLLMLALEHVIKHRDMYDQGDWVSDCGAVRCLAGWVAFFGGWRTVPGYDDGWVCAPAFLPTREVHLEDAALISLELNPDIYGTEVDAHGRWQEMEDFADSLFLGSLAFIKILAAVLDLMKADGVTPTPLIQAEMKSAGVLSDWDTW